MITLTEPAAARIADQIAKSNAFALRFAAKESGCSGYSYVMDLADQANEGDIVFESFDVKVVIDAKSLEILTGTQIDYVAEGLNQTFKFSNPRSTNECGCGESFALEAQANN